MKKKSKFTLVPKDKAFVEFVSKTDKKILARWAVECTERVLHYFEEKYPEDSRPRTALEKCRKWVKTGVFSMAVIRKASLDSHAAAREVGEDDSARSAARSSGQAVATAHARMHSIAAANYALQAIHRAADASKADEEVEKERKWQNQRLLELTKKK
ncbi:MAG: putative immunity protein [Candidatus Micrarchaeota archaeon]